MTRPIAMTMQMTLKWRRLSSSWAYRERAWGPCPPASCVAVLEGKGKPLHNSANSPDVSILLLCVIYLSRIGHASPCPEHALGDHVPGLWSRQLSTLVLRHLHATSLGTHELGVVYLQLSELLTRACSEYMQLGATTLCGSFGLPAGCVPTLCACQLCVTCHA